MVAPTISCIFIFSPDLIRLSLLSYTLLLFRLFVQTIALLFFFLPPVIFRPRLLLIH
jgi:hypothetical protein